MVSYCLVLKISHLLIFLDDTVKTKKCYGCNKVLPIEKFTKNKNNKDGLSYYCRDCTKIQYKHR